MCSWTIELRMKCNKISASHTTPHFYNSTKRLWCGFDAGDTTQPAEKSPSKHLKGCGNYHAKKKNMPHLADGWTKRVGNKKTKKCNQATKVDEKSKGGEENSGTWTCEAVIYKNQQKRWKELLQRKQNEQPKRKSKQIPFAFWVKSLVLNSSKFPILFLMSRATLFFILPVCSPNHAQPMWFIGPGPGPGPPPKYEDELRYRTRPSN